MKDGGEATFYERNYKGTNEIDNDNICITTTTVQQFRVDQTVGGYGQHFGQESDIYSIGGLLVFNAGMDQGTLLFVCCCRFSFAAFCLCVVLVPSLSTYSLSCAPLRL